MAMDGSSSDLIMEKYRKSVGVEDKEETVNIVIHGHEPALSEMLAVAVQDPEVKAYAKKAGAGGITLAGLCCTANEILMRHGVPVAGNFLQQELAVVTASWNAAPATTYTTDPRPPLLTTTYS